jgi:hypothetical protein
VTSGGVPLYLSLVILIKYSMCGLMLLLGKPIHYISIMYVPTSYMSITACYTDQWKEWWMNPNGVCLI